MKPILNSDFELPADGFFHAIALGEFPNSRLAPDPAGGKLRMQKVLQVCDAAACAEIAAAFNNAARSHDFAGLLVDYDHMSDDPEHTTEAAGWVTALENRADGLYARIRWTDTGGAAVRGGRFRFLSPVFAPADCADLGNNRLRPLRLARLALTNDPNIRPLRPLTNRAAAPADSGNESPGMGRKESTMDFKAELLAMLGLDAEATDEQIAAALAAAKQKAGDLENACRERDAMKNRAETAERRVQELEKADLDRQVEGDLEEFKDVIVNRATVKAQLLVNRAGMREALAGLKARPAAGRELHRTDGRAPTDGGAADAQKFNNRRVQQDKIIRDLMRNRNIPSHEAAWHIARLENPEVFEA